MEQEQKNPFLEQEDYFAGYKKNMEALRNDPSVIEFDKLCFELFGMNEQGKKFMEMATERWLIPAVGKVGNPTYQIEVLWGEGFKDFLRMIRTGIHTHMQRLKVGSA